MKKLFAILLAVAMLTSMATIVSAAELTTTSTTTLTTTVQPASYMLNIPLEKTISFGAQSSSIGNVTVTNPEGFAYGKDLKVTVSYSEFTCEGVSTTIPFTLSIVDTGDNTKSLNSGDALLFKTESDGTMYEKAFVGFDSTMHQDRYVDRIYVRINGADWGKALAGTYTATITYTAEVVAGE